MQPTNPSTAPSPPTDPPASLTPGFRISNLARGALLALEMTLATLALLSLVSLVLFPMAATPLVLTISATALGILIFCECARATAHYFPPCLQRVIYGVTAAVGELFALLATICLYPFRLSRYNIAPANIKGEKPLVIFAHGFLHNSSAGWYLRHRFQKAGYPTVAVNQTEWFGDINCYGKQIATLAKEYEGYIKKKGVVLIGHSMGGAASFVAAKTLADEGHTVRLITLGSPLLGTKMAYLIPATNTRQLRPGSAFLKTLPEGALFPRLHLGSRDDLVLLCSKSALLDQTEEQLVDGLGHLQLLYSDQIIDRALTFAQQSLPPIRQVPV